MRKVEAQSVRLDKGACLMGMLAEHSLERGVEQVRRRVRAANGVAALRVDGCKTYW